MNRRSRSLAQVAALAVISIVAGLSAWAWQDAPAQKQTFGTWGVDLTSRDPRVKPGDDFFAYANGAYLARTEIPPDQARTRHRRVTCSI